MTPTEEARLLSAILKRVEGGGSRPGNGRWLAIGNWLVLVAAFLALFNIGPRVGPVVYVVAAVAVVLGTTTCLAVIYRRSFDHWGVLAPYIKADELRHRIQALKPNPKA